MILPPWAWGLVFFSYGFAATPPTKRFYDSHAYYAVEYYHESASGLSLHEVFDALGVEAVEQVGELRDVWLVRVPYSEFAARSTEAGEDVVESRYRALQAQASNTVDIRSEQEAFARRAISSIKFLERQTPRRLAKRAPTSLYESADAVSDRLGLMDPLFSEQWHLINDEYPEHMMNTTPVWDMGFTGHGVYTSFIDDGLDFEHEDLRDAFDAENSYDFNEHVALPRPVSSIDDHGTRCAGQVAARRNEVCGVGIAYNAKAAGVRILGGSISFVDEAAALNYGFEQVSLYSCSWGPRDDGKHMDGPGYLVRKAVVNGINEGRDGKGSIFVFASGNGGDFHDQCNFDGYTNSIYSVTVSAVDYKGLHPSYSEECTANMIVAYTSGSGRHIVTTDRGNNKCTHGHSGTSAAAPNAVGVFALALEARPELTWRDIQHLCIETARIVSPEDISWERTATGRFYSNKFGYGAIDAYAYVKAAQDWVLVKPQAWLHTHTIQVGGGRTYDYGHGNYTYEGGERIKADGFESTLTITADMMKSNNLETLEHLDIRVWISHSRRGDVEVEIISPHGIKSVLAKKRPLDDATTGFPGWRFMSVKHWGENPVGDWTLRIFDQNDRQESGKVLGWNMVLWGSSINPMEATKFLEPVIDNILPPEPISQLPHFPVSTTQHAKPTDHLPPQHLPPTQGHPYPSIPTHVDSSTPPGSQNEGITNKMTESAKWYYLLAGVMLGLLIAVGIYRWGPYCRRRRSEYTALSNIDDIDMGPVRSNLGHRASFFSSSERKVIPLRPLDLDDVSETGTMEPSNNQRRGLNTSILEDDELSPPIFRPGPEERPLYSLTKIPYIDSGSQEDVDGDGSWSDTIEPKE